MKLFSRNKDVILAENIFSTLGVGRSLTSKEQHAVTKAISNCTSRQDILNVVIDLCSPANTPRKRYLKAMALSWSKAEYRPQAITAITEYLSNGLYEGAFKGIIKGEIYGFHPDARNAHIASMYTALGKAYEGEYLFDEALNSYNSALNLEPFYPFSYYNVANIYKKMNRLDLARNTYETAKQSPFYSPYVSTDMFGQKNTDKTFQTVIDRNLCEINDLIKNGYVYRPRNKKPKR